MIDVGIGFAVEGGMRWCAAEERHAAMTDLLEVDAVRGGRAVDLEIPGMSPSLCQCH